MSTVKPDPKGLVGFRFERSLIDWNDDGNVTDYGWKLLLFINGKHRARWVSTKGTNRMRPHVSRGADENCNRSITFAVWPVGHLDVWWETNWRPVGSGPCEECLAEEVECWLSRPLPPAAEGLA